EQLATGGSLLSLLHKHQQEKSCPAVGLPYTEVLRLGGEIAGAMAYLHANGVVHRDLKTGNVLLDGQNRALVADLGLAKTKLEGSCLSTRNACAGTPAFMAPEQFEGRRTNEKVDQYAFGVLLWELLTGQRPWQELDHPMQIIFVVGVQCQRLPIPGECPAAMADMLHACWDEVPEGRPSFSVIEQQIAGMRKSRHGQGSQLP
ncbi:serine/threonine protein kinase, partial [Dunaliella salina]